MARHFKIIENHTGLKNTYLKATFHTYCIILIKIV